MKKSGMKYICAAIMVGAAIGLIATVRQPRGSMRSTRRSAKRAVSAVDDLICSVKDMMN